MASSYSPAYGGQVRRYSREELLLLRTSPSCLMTSPPAVPDCVPLQKRSGLEEVRERRKEPQIPDRDGYRQSTNHKPLSTRPRQPNGRSKGEEASVETTVDAREMTRRWDSREKQTAPIKQRKRPFNADYFLGLQDDTELTIRLYKNIEEFDVYLKSDFVPVSGVEKLVKILHKVLACELQRESVLKILQVVCSSRFLDQHLQTYIDHLQKCSKIFEQDEITEVVEKVLDLLSSICHRLPSERSKVYLIMNYTKSQNNLAAVLFNSPVVAKQFEEVLAQSQKLLTTQRKVTGAKNKRTGDEDDEIPPEDFIDLPVFPDRQDLDYSKVSFLRPSKTVGAFKDAHHYLDVHFRLLREDFLRPLRNGISNMKAIDRNDPHPSNMDVRLYKNVRIIGTAPGKTFDHVIQFDTQPFQKVRWQSSKRLIFGSLVCLSYDNFESVFFAVVTNREVNDVENGIIHVYFEGQTGEVVGLSNDVLFTMVESVAFFEATRHVLEGLKEMKNLIPMSRYIVECQKEVNARKYLTASGAPVTMNLKSLVDPESHVNVENVPVTDSDAWASDIDWELNASQLGALKMALTSELAIIQGPPGTGKTYVGLKIVEVLLDNEHVWNADSKTRPILVVCYTNHALDQFLEAILDFCPEDIVRVGSRCQSEALSPFNISEIRKCHEEGKSSMARDLSSSVYECRLRMEETAKHITQIKALLTKTFSDIIKANDLKSHILPQHYTSFTTKSVAIGLSSTAAWLCGGVVVKNEEGYSKTDHYDQLVQKVTSQILQGEADFGQVDLNDLPVDVCSEDFPVRAQLYRSWLKGTKQRLSHEVQKAKEAGVSPRALEEWLEAAETEILPDYILEPDIDKNLFKAITYRKNLPRKIYAPYFIRLWLGIDTISRNNKDLLIVMRELLEAQQGDVGMDDYCEDSETNYEGDFVDSPPGEVNFVPELPASQSFAGKNATPEKQTEVRQVRDDTSGLNIDEEAEFLQKQRLLDDDENNKVVLQTFDESEDRKSAPGNAEVSEWEMARRQTGRNFQKIIHLVKTLTPLSEEEAAMITDLWDISLDVMTRVRLYLSWIQKYRKHLKDTIKALAERYATESRMLSELNLERDGLILKKAKVIGMTTTAAARNRRLLATVGCPIVIMEEAAEVLEAHVVTTLSSSCQHLILIGDHQQLRPSATVYELCRQYHLDLSLFERLVNNDLPHSTLTTQHRMRPEVARLVRHVYPDLKDHLKTLNRPRVRGVKHDVFFFHHEVEEASDADGKSKSNYHEAELCVALCRYFVQQGYHASSITILVAYTGQILTVKKLLMADKNFYSGVRVTSIDNYQGEENDIIILSLVRSNKEGKVGFLKTDNRVCVALSRAKLGLYAFGNFRVLAANSQLWEKVIKTAREHGQFGRSLAMCCENHPDRETLVSTAEDFKKSPEGGCMLPCAAKLECGHTCRLLCHGYDTNHEEYRCMESCSKVLCQLGHKCPQKCYVPCQPCKKIISKTIPGCFHTISIACSVTPVPEMCEKICQKIISCGHTLSIACSKTAVREMCKERCQEVLPCGHVCSGKCGTCSGRSKHECSVKVERPWACGHMIRSRCDVMPEKLPCPTKCKAALKCGHVCPGSCGECHKGTRHVKCQEKCVKPLPGCGHRCQGICSDPCSPCQRECKFACAHGKCGDPCNEICKPCTSPCPFGCPHRPCRALCSEPCEPCTKNCTKRLRCGHKCAGKCKETCFCSACERKYFFSMAPGKEKTPGRPQSMIRLPRCGHIFTTAALDEYVNEKIKAFPYETSLPCPACQAPIYAWDTWRYLKHLTSNQENLREIKDLFGRKSPKPCSLISKLWDADVKDQRFCVCSLIYQEKTLDVLKALEVSRQIKLLRITQMITEHLEAFRTKHVTFSKHEIKTSLQQDILAMQTSLRSLGSSMTRQKYLELKDKVTWMVCILSLLCARHILLKAKTEDTLLSSVNKVLLQLTSKSRRLDLIPKVKTFINSYREKAWWTRERLISMDILDDPLDVDLCKAFNSLKIKPEIHIQDDECTYSKSE